MIEESGKRMRVAAVRAAENDDGRMFADEHVQIAAHQDHECEDADARQQA